MPAASAAAAAATAEPESYRVNHLCICRIEQTVVSADDKKSITSVQSAICRKQPGGGGRVGDAGDQKGVM